jgi:hypothetical protein
VVVSREGSHPISVVHPHAISPIDLHTGMEREIPLLTNGKLFRWHPQSSPDGPVSLVLSVSGSNYHNGIEIARTRVTVKDFLPGTHAYIVAKHRHSRPR